MNELILQVRDSKRGVLMRVQFHESEPSIGLHTDFDDVAVALKERDEVCLRGIRDEVADVNGSVEIGCLRCDTFV